MNRTKLQLILTPMAMAMILSGCATPEGKFPSLARRPFEQGAAVIAPIVPLTPLASSLPEAISGKVRALQSRHANASSAFSSMLPVVRSAANGAASAPMGSEAWVNAQLMVSRLDKSRGDAVAALSEMDDLIVAQLDSESQGVIFRVEPLLKPIQVEMAATVEQQNQEVERLSRIIGL
jgi:hypothetical protein